MTPTLGDMTKADLETLIAEEVRRQLAQIALVTPAGESATPARLRSPLEIPVLDIPWHDGLSALSREDYYDDNGR